MVMQRGLHFDQSRQIGFVFHMMSALGGAQIFSFLIAAAASVAVLYAILLIFTALVF
jgi:lipid-A-disaccharide synthase-like uncharacterized protein